MPHHNNDERLSQRLDEIVAMVRKEWPEADILRLPPQEAFEPPRIRIEITRPQKVGENRVALILRTNRSLMNDIGIPTERIFREGIHMACKTFDSTPNKDRILQGTVIMTSKEVRFERYSGPE
jgi:hypothetical protein